MEIELSEERVDLPDNFMETAPRVNLSRRAIITGLAAGTVFPIVSGCTTNPETGRTQIAFMGDTQIAEMASSAWTDLKSQTPQTSDTRLKNRVLGIWDRIQDGATAASVSGRRWNEEQWDVAVFDQDTVNAFVMPGNKVGVYRGITELTENDDQLASVLGHELGHVAGRHASERLSMNMLGQVALVGTQIAVASSESLKKYGNEIAAVAGLGLQFGVLLPYSRKHELESDILGVDYMHEAGYKVAEAPRLWELMAKQSEGQRPPAFMSTHPDPVYRAQNLRNYINAKGYDLV